MTTNSHINSGFRSIAIDDVNGNVIGVTVDELVVPDVANLSIGGGTSGQVLSTDGAGNLSWITSPGTSIADYLANGTSNLIFASGNNHIYMSVGGNANIVTITSNTTTVNGIADLNGISNIQLSGGNPNKYIQSSNDSGDLSWGPDQYVISELGYGYGRLFTVGDKVWAAGRQSGSYCVNGPSASNVGPLTSQSITIDSSSLPPSVPPLEYFVKIYDRTQVIYVLGNNGILYSVGNNNTGQIGLYVDTTQYAYALTPITNLNVYGPDITVENFWASHDCIDSAVYGQCIVKAMNNGVRKYSGFGYNAQGSLGVGTSTTGVLTPLPIPELENKNLVSVSMTDTSSLVVTDTGEVWAAGDNSFGQLGIGNTTTPITSFTRATFATGNVVITGAAEVQTSALSSPAPSTYVSFVRLTDGTVYGCGTGLNNKLGNGSTANQNRFVQVLKAAATPLTNIVKIRSRAGDTMALDSTGNLWTWGVNNDYLWGNGEASGTTSTYAKIIQTGISDFWIMSRNYDSPVTPTRYMIFTKTDGTTWGCGMNFNFQIGTDSLIGGGGGYVQTAARVYFSEKGEYCIQAKPLGYYSSIFLTNKNRVYVCGIASTDGASYGNCTTIPIPVPVNDVKYY